MLSLDRFEVGLIDVQQVPDVGWCENCHSDIYKGQEIVRYEGDMFCDQHCLGEYLVQNADYEEVDA